MDIHLAIAHLGLNQNQYRLTQSVPPHSIIEWNGPDPQPTDIELQDAYDQAIAIVTLNNSKQNRADAYRTEADPLFFQYQAGEVTKEEWLTKREEIRARYPYPS